MADINDTIADNLGLVYHQLHRFNMVGNPDAESYAYEALFKAASTYKPSSGNKFSTYAICVIANSLRMYLRTCNKKNVIVPVSYYTPAYIGKNGEELLLVDTIEGPNHAEDHIYAIELRRRITEALRSVYEELPTDNQRSVFRAWVKSDFSMKQRELAQATGLSQAQVSRVLNHTRQQLRLELEDYL